MFFFFFLTGVLGSSFCCVLSSLMPAEQGQGMTIEWYFTEDWGRASRIRERKEGGGFISITSRMPRTFLEWHVYGTAWQEHTHFIGFIRETRGGTSRIWDVVCVCGCVCVCLGVSVSIHACTSKLLLLCAHSAICGVWEAAFLLSVAAIASSPNTFTCLCFGLSAL